jgi:SAM-dependent methyltransferase
MTNKAEDNLKCPLCSRRGRLNSKHPQVGTCSEEHGKFEWINRNILGDMDPKEIHDSLPYSQDLKSHFHQMRSRYLRGFQSRVSRYFSSIQKLSFLDVGCANGEYLDCAVELGMKPVAGIEIDQAALVNAKKVAPVFSDIAEVKEQYDVVQCKNVLSNIADFHEFFKKLLSYVKPGGVVFVDVLNNHGLTSFVKRLKGKPGMLKPPFIINGFSQKSIVWLVDRNNSRVIHMNTAYTGDDMVPYAWTLLKYLAGNLEAALGTAVMIITDITST